MEKDFKRQTCITVLTDVFEKYQNLCDRKLSTVSHELSEFMKAELEREEKAGR